MKYVTIDSHGVVVGRSSSPVTMEGYLSVPYDGVLDDTRQWKYRDGEFAEVTPPQDEVLARAWADVRRRRNLRLQDCDWTALPGVPMSDAQRQAWATYRQALRDITEQPDPLAIVWPTPPA